MISAAVSPIRDAIAVSVDGRTPVQVHAMWIRDACGCLECRRAVTNERLIDTKAIESSITVLDSALDEDLLRVDLSDGHTSIIDTDWLAERVRALEPVGPADGIELWIDGGQTLEEFDRSDLDEPAGLLAWLDAILERGVAVVHGVSPDEAGHRSVAALVGPIRATNYGLTWEIEATLQPVSGVESERHLFVHTDLPYRSEAPGCSCSSPPSPTWRVAHPRSSTDSPQPNDFAPRIRSRGSCSARVEFTYPYSRSDVEVHGQAPLIGLRRNGSYDQIRRAPGLVGVPIVDIAETPALYAAVRRWDEIVDDPNHELSVRLEPGDLLAFDNHRMLHGRTAFELGASGRRQLLGCYLDRDTVLSRRALTAREVSNTTDH